MRRLNPDLRLYGLYGGDADSLREAAALKPAGLDDVYLVLADQPARNKWKDTDLAVAEWFRTIGRSILFDRVHVIQWDLLIFDSLDRVYPPLADDTVALTGLTPLAAVAHFWDWTVQEPLATTSSALIEAMRRRFNYRGDPFVCIGPGYSLSRDFLARYSDVDHDHALGHDELRLPLFAEMLGFKLIDTGFYPRWRDPEVECVFNADPKEIDPERVAAELRRVGGRRVFHPCRSLFDAAQIKRLSNLLATQDG